MNNFSSSDAALTSMMAGLGIFALVIVLIVIGLAIFYVVALAKLFEKAGKPGWAAIVPIYNTIVLYEIVGFKWYYIFVSLLTYVPVVGSLAVLFFIIVLNIKLSKSFGQSVGYGIGLAFLPIVFVPMFAFSKNISYAGPAVNGDIDFNDLF